MAFDKSVGRLYHVTMRGVAGKRLALEIDQKVTVFLMAQELAVIFFCNSGISTP